MVEAQRAPRVALARLHHGVGIGQSRFEGIFPHLFPRLFAAVVCAHVVDVDRGYLRCVVPAVAGFDHALYAGAVIAVDSSEHTRRRHFARFFWRNAPIDKMTLRLYDSFGHMVWICVVIGCCRHFHSAAYQEEARRRKVAKLSGSLYHDVDTRAPQLFRGD